MIVIIANFIFCPNIIYFCSARLDFSISYKESGLIQSTEISLYLAFMVSVLASSAIDCGYELRSCQTKEYKIGICCFSAKNAALRRKSKDWLARNQNNVSEWSDISTQ